jgi:GAF domain-containing protein
MRPNNQEHSYLTFMKNFIGSQWRSVKRVFFTDSILPSTEREFQQRMTIPRAIFLFAIILRFELQPSAIEALIQIRFSYIIYLLCICAFYLIPKIKPVLAVTRWYQMFQVVTDSLSIIYWYWIAADPGSEIFLFYAIPVLTMGRFSSRKRWYPLFLLVIITVTILTWAFADPTNPLFGNSSFWVSTLLPKIGYLAILTLFYITLRRRYRFAQQMLRKRTQENDPIVNLGTGVIVFDNNRRIISANETFQQWYKGSPQGKTCRSALCAEGRIGNNSCGKCPVSVVYKNPNKLLQTKHYFADANGDPFLAEMVIIPELNRKRKIIRARAIITNLSLQDRFAIDYKIMQQQVVKNYLPSDNKDRPSENLFSELLHTLVDRLRGDYADLRLAVNDNQLGNTYLVLHASVGYILDEYPEWRFLDISKTSIIATTFVDKMYQTSSELHNRPDLIHYQEKVALFDLNVVLCFPLIANNQCIGTVSVYRSNEQPFDQNEIIEGRRYISQMALALANLDETRQLGQWEQLYQEQLSKYQRLEKLNEYFLRLSKTLNVNDSLDIIAQATADLLDCDMAGVALWNEVTKSFCGVLGHGYVGVSDLYAKEFEVCLDEPGAEVWFGNRTYQAYDVQDDFEIFGISLTSPINVRGILASALQISDKPIGILYAGSKLPRRFSDEEEQIFNLIASQSAIDIRNNQLLQSKEKLAKEKVRNAEINELFHQISLTSQRINDVEIILNIILTGITAHYGLRFNRAAFFELTKSQGFLQGRAAIGQLTEYDAKTIWEEGNYTQTFDEHIHHVFKYGLPPDTHLHSEVVKNRILVKKDGLDLVSQILFSEDTSLVTVKANSGRRESIPEGMLKLFCPTCFAIIPVNIEGRPLGILVIDRFVDPPLEDDCPELDYVQTCANLLAVALQRSYLQEELKNRIDDLKSLRKIAHSITQLRDFSDFKAFSQHILEASDRVLKADFSSLIPVDDDNLQWEWAQSTCKGAVKPYLGYAEESYKPSGLTKLIIHSQRNYILFEDFPSQKEVYGTFPQTHKVFSLAIIRLEVAGKPVGILFVNYQKYHTFTNTDIMSLHTLANQAAIALYNWNTLKRSKQVGIENERNRLRFDIHDNLNTLRYKVMLPLENIRDRLLDEQQMDFAKEIDYLFHYCKRTNDAYRQIMKDMHHPILVEEGLAVALAVLENDYRRDASLRIDLDVTGTAPPPSKVEHAFYRIAQEAVNNIVEHAGNGIQVHISLSLKDGETLMVIKDNGCGFNMNSQDVIEHSIGIASMEYYAKTVAAELVVYSKVGHGTSVTVCLSYEPEL